MKDMNNKFRAVILAAGAGIGLLLSGPFLGAMDWPSAEAAMVNNFGSNDGGRPVLGNTFEGEGPVMAADGGELIFSRGEGDTASRLPSPLGSWLALDHGDGIVSIYSRFEDGKAPVPQRVEKNVPVAEAGLSGWSAVRGFYFSLFDRKERRWVNPSMIIIPLEDTRPPIIQSVRLRNSEGRYLDMAPARTISQGRYTVVVGAADTRLESRERPLAPHRIVCSNNGSEIGVLNFETYSARDGSLMVYRNGLIPVKQVYAPSPAFEVGEVWFTRGQATLEIIAQDIAGNAQSAVYRIAVE